MESLDHRITSDDDGDNNLGKTKKYFVSRDDVPNDEESFGALSPDEVLMLKEETTLQEQAEQKLELEKNAMDDKDNHTGPDVEPSQGGGGVGTKAQKWFKENLNF